ncbi:MAG: ADP-dependent glucokinase/phosphofructokinase [Candidatus Micrarchaeota archaeon]
MRISSHMFHKIDRMLPEGTLRIGGQAGNMAVSASRLLTRSYLHTPNYSRKMLSLFKSRRVLVACGESFLPARECGDDSEPLTHMIFEFKKGKNISSSDRFIVSFESENPSLPINPIFSRNILPVIQDIPKAIIGGFHLVPPRLLRKRMSGVLAQIRKWKRINPCLRMHLELGDFLSHESEILTVKHILPEVHSVGLNESELPTFLNSLGSGRIESVLDKTGTVVLHTGNYSLALSRDYSQKALASSLAFASCVSGFKALKGHSPTFSQLAKAQFKRKRIIPPRIRGASTDIPTAFSPSVNIKPKYTIGLGDCFSMAFFLSLK